MRYETTYCLAFFETLPFQDNKIQTGIRKAVSNIIDNDRPSIAKENIRFDGLIHEIS
jgi:hypothetical protein